MFCDFIAITRLRLVMTQRNKRLGENRENPEGDRCNNPKACQFFTVRLSDCGNGNCRSKSQIQRKEVTEDRDDFVRNKVRENSSAYKG